jgi:hypothetical protein
MKKIEEVVAALNARLESTELGTFYDRRQRLNAGRRKSGGLFQVTHDQRKPLSGYSFHWGGRSELQFNVGFEEARYFRYGVAFSLEPDRNLQDPVAVLYPKILQFNAMAPGFPVLQGLRMWSYQRGVRSADGAVTSVPPQLVQSGTFVFIGERVDVSARGVTPEVLERAVAVLTSLLPLYEQIEGGAATAPYKVARLCWNTDYWQRPTGRFGKVDNEGAFEGIHGYGHEEWLFDQSRMIGGWKYGFLQALNHSHAKYAGQPLNFLLYTIDSRTKSRYWVATIKQAEVLTKPQAKAARKAFEEEGWVDEMKSEVEVLGLDSDSLSVANAVELLNLRYRPENLTLFQPPIPFPRDALPAYRYGTLQNVPSSQLGVTQGLPEATALSERNINVLKTTRSGYVVDKEIDLVHKRWQKELKVSLRKALPDAKVSVEVPVGGHSIDVVVEQGGKRVFFELKTRSVVRQVIREALAQLMEYCYWPPTQHRADALLIVGAGSAGAEDQEYLALLRERFRIPVHYRQYRDGGIVGITELVESVIEGTDSRAPA